MNDHERYLAAAHAVQSGIAYAQDTDSALFEPKHMRVAIDMSKSDHEGLATLLMSKGLFTTEEYNKAMADAAEREKARWEKHLSEKMGTEVTLA